MAVCECVFSFEMQQCLLFNSLGHLIGGNRCKTLGKSFFAIILIDFFFFLELISTSKQMY